MKATAAPTSPARMEKAAPLTYVLITPARNEEAHIELTIKSVLSQTVRPAKWVIVSDGSTDRTDEIVKRYAAAHDWIELLRMPEREERHFAGKVHAFNAGAARVSHLPYDIIGNLDGDVSFDSDYIEYLLGKFSQYPLLGVITTRSRGKSVHGMITGSPASRTSREPASCSDVTASSPSVDTSRAVVVEWTYLPHSRRECTAGRQECTQAKYSYTTDNRERARPIHFWSNSTTVAKTTCLARIHCLKSAAPSIA